MGYRVKQTYESGQEAAGGYSYGFLAVDSAADFANMATWQDGSVAYIEGDPDSLYFKISGAWTLQKKTPIEPGRHIEIDGVDPFTLLAANHLFARRAEIAAALAAALAADVAAGKNQYYIRTALPTTEADNFEGMIVYETTGHTLSVCTTPGEQELDTVTVTKGAITQAGVVTITLNEQPVTVTLVKGETASSVAAKIKAAVDAAVVAKDIAAWTVTCAGAVLTFKKDVTGAASPPTAVDTGDTGATFGTFARTNQGVTAVWGTLINAL